MPIYELFQKPLEDTFPQRIPPPTMNNSTADSRQSPPSSNRVSDFFKSEGNLDNGALTQPNITNQSVTKLTNKHTTNTHKPNRKKRTTTSRACDACALRKIRCEPTTPCSHCKNNGWVCTRNRERKKSGPKALSKRTIDSINNLSEVIELNTSRPQLSSKNSSTSVYSKSPSIEETESHRSSPSARSSVAHSVTPNPVQQRLHSQSNQGQMGVALVGQAHGSAASQFPESSTLHSTQLQPLASNDTQTGTSTEEYLVTPFYLMENLNLIGEEPAIRELLAPLTVNSVLTNYSRLVSFLTTNYPNMINTSGINTHFTEINLVDHHDDSLYLSTLLIIITLNQIIAEILIKLKKQKFKKFLRYPKKFLAFRPYKSFKNLCHFKVLEIFSLIEKNFIVPSIIPKTRANGNQYLFAHLNQYQIYYNLSLSNIQLCNYNHILNLTNTLNSATEAHNAYGNEAQEHQKILYLSRAISTFQLISVKESDSLVPLRELYELIYSFERYYIIFSSYNYDVNLFRNNNVLTHLKSDRYHGEGYAFELMHIIDDLGLIDPLCRNAWFNLLLEFDKPQPGYIELKGRIDALRCTDYMWCILREILLFKIMLVRPLSFDQSKLEVVRIIDTICRNLELADSDVFKVKVSNYQILQPLLHILKVFLEIKQVEVRLGKPVNIQDQELLVRYTELIITHLPFFNNINKLIRAHKILNNWFLMLSEVKKDDTSEKQEQPQLQSQIYQPTPPTPQANIDFPFHTGITPQAQQPTFSHLQPQQRLASQIDVNELMRDFTVSRLDGDFDVNNPTPTIQYRADDDEDDEEQDFFTIVPKNEHGHKFANQTSGAADFLANAPPTPQFCFPSVVNNNNLPMSASTRSFFSLLNATNYVEDNQADPGQADPNQGSDKGSVIGSSFFNLSNLR